jgi:hypothetical protein
VQPDQRSENEKLAHELQRARQDLLRISEVLERVYWSVLDLPSAYRRQKLNVPAGEPSLVSTPSPTTAAIRMEERSQDVPYETAYPISKK